MTNIKRLDTESPDLDLAFLLFCIFWLLELGSREVSLQRFVHAQGALQLLDNTLVKGYLLPEVGLHHVFEVHLSLLMEVAHLCLEGKPNCPAAFPNAVGLVLVHLPLVTHALALFYFGKGPWVEIKSYKNRRLVRSQTEHQGYLKGQFNQMPKKQNKTKKKERKKS